MPKASTLYVPTSFVPYLLHLTCTSTTVHLPCASTDITKQWFAVCNDSPPAVTVLFGTGGNTGDRDDAGQVGLARPMS